MGEHPKTAQLTPPQRVAVRAAGGLKLGVDSVKKRRQWMSIRA